MSSIEKPQAYIPKNKETIEDFKDEYKRQFHSLTQSIENNNVWEIKDKYKKFFMFIEKSNEKIYLPMGHIELWFYFYKKSKFKEAIEELKKGIDIVEELYEKTPESREVLFSYYFLSVSYFELDNFEEAMLYVDKFIEVVSHFEEINNVSKEYARGYYLKWQIYKHQWDKKEAHKWFSKSWEADSSVADFLRKFKKNY